MAANTLSSLAAQLRSPKTIAIPPALQNPKVAAAAAVALSISIPALSLAARSYRGFLALGPGGIPHNVLGWSLQGLLQLVARADTRSTAPFADPANQGAYAPHGAASFLGAPPLPPLPGRAGPRPDVPGYVAPQRQTTQQGRGEVRARMVAHLEAAARGNPAVLAARPSGLEGVGTPAVYVAQGVDIPAYLGGVARGEIVHVHPEGSSHVTVSLADAEELVRKGWAERHRLSGAWMGMPWGYLLIYAPRDEDELEVWKRIVRAGLGFVCAGSGKELAPFEEAVKA